MDDVFTVSEVAKRLKVAERTVHAMLAAGELPGFKIRGQWRLRRVAFEAWLDAISGSSSVPTEPPASTKTPPSETSTDDVDASIVSQQAGSARRLSTEELNRAFVDALGSKVQHHSDLSRKPLDLDLKHPLPQSVRVYLFNATKPAGGRPLGEHKIQLILPDQKRSSRGKFAHDDGLFIMLVGYSSDDEVFMLWDAGLYDDFAYSRNVQVKASTILNASVGGIAQQERVLRPKGAPPITEVVLAASASHLDDALIRRVELTIARL